MPTLAERKDGIPYVRHFYRDHATWQIDAEGVRLLRIYGIVPEMHFSTTLFMQLYMMNLVYTGAARPASDPIKWAPPSTPLDIELDQRVRSLYRLLCSNDLPAAFKFVASDTDSSLTFDEFASQVTRQRGFHLVAWRVKAVGSSAWSDSEFHPRAIHSGRALVTFDLEDQDGAREKHVDEFELWFHIDGQWYWLWRPWSP